MPAEIGRAILKTALARATAGSEGARFVGAQLTGVAGSTVQAMLEGLKNLVDGKVDGTDSRLSDARTPKDASVTNAKVDAAAAIAESKLALASDAAAATPSRRTLGNVATSACAGNDSRLSDPRTPIDASVTAAKMAAANKGIVICTSTTRPSAGANGPVEGQHIYETDTDATLKNTGTPAAPVWSALGGGSAADAPADGTVVRRIASQSIATSVVATIAWDTEISDVPAWFPGADATQIVVSKAGLYLLAAGTQWASNATGVRQFFINAAGAVVASPVGSAGADALGRMSATAIVPLNAGDVVTLSVFQNSGAALGFGNITANQAPPYLAVTRLK